jgi:hypothetical protein
MAEKTTEISFEVSAEEAAVLDGYCSAKGIKRTVVMRRLLREWSIEKHHESILIVRVAGSNPATPGVSRNE